MSRNVEEKPYQSHMNYHLILGDSIPEHHLADIRECGYTLVEPYMVLIDGVALVIDRSDGNAIYRQYIRGGFANNWKRWQFKPRKCGRNSPQIKIAGKMYGVNAMISVFEKSIAVLEKYRAS